MTTLSQNNQTYAAPAVKVLEVSCEQIICDSGKRSGRTPNLYEEEYDF